MQGVKTMFDKLVESTKSRQGRRAGRYFAVTTMIYALALVALGIGTIIGFTPALAEEYDLTALLAPPLPVIASPPPTQAITQTATRPDAPLDIFVPPDKPPVDIPDPSKITDFARRTIHVVGDAAFPTGIGSGNGRGCIGCLPVGDSSPPPAPPPPPPTPTPTPEAKPSGPARVSEGVLQGKAVRKQKPAYPAIARTVKANGMVQVLVSISEEGRVIEANAISGHPMLRPAAVEAARQWVFTPTLLSGVPVKVQGVLSFNFILE